MKKIHRAAVIWYSQTEHTAIYGRLIAEVFSAEGIECLAEDYRNINQESLRDIELLVIGTPVFYGDIPVNMRQWLLSLPSLMGIPAAAYVTCGGKGGGYYSTDCNVLALLRKKGAIPLDMAAFHNMSTFTPTWSWGGRKLTLAYGDLPNEKTYESVRSFAKVLLGEAETDPIPVLAMEAVPIGAIARVAQHLIKFMITKHRIDKSSCSECGICEQKCPVQVIDCHEKTVMTKRCIACFGCVNTCPTGALQMNFLGKSLLGFTRFREKYNVLLKKP